MQMTILPVVLSSNLNWYKIQSRIPNTPAVGTQIQHSKINQLDQKPMCLFNPTVLNTNAEPALGSIVDSSAYRKAMGSTATVISPNPKKVAGPV